jgi:nucleoside-diphosphate-sugar epimerase
MIRPSFVLLGLGFTTRRLARRFLFRGLETFAAVRDPERFRDLSALGLRFDGHPKGAVVVHTVPPLPRDENDAVHELIRGLAPRRVVYISSTSVYGNVSEVDETTPANPSDDKGRRRIEEEAWLQAGPWETLVIRPAAIYGPGRGVHVRVKEGRTPRGEPGGITSRIHVDDLAALLEAGALSGLTGAWPVADDYPCPTAEVAAWCGAHWEHKTSVRGRRVDGRKVRELLETGLRHPDYQSGILASLAEESASEVDRARRSRRRAE